LDAALTLESVVKTFGDFRAVDGLDLVVPRGATYGVIGPSGAGKTTTIRLIMAILFPDSGVLTVLGKRSALEAKDRIGYLPEERGAYRKMCVDAFLLYIAELKGVTPGVAKERIAKLLTRLALGEIGTKKCEDLSKGMLQRVQFIASIINEPELLILDEPFSGLDPVSVRLLKEVIADERKRGATILFSTHVMAQAEELCDQIVMIHKGRKVLDEPMSGLRRQFDTRTILFEPLDARADVSRLDHVAGVESVKKSDQGISIHLAAGTDPAQAMRDVAATSTPARIELSRIRLEDVFVRLVTQAGESQETERALRTHLQGQSVIGSPS
jgi:ABC-2 type transport system ATP-binding protein